MFFGFLRGWVWVWERSYISLSLSWVDCFRDLLTWSCFTLSYCGRSGSSCGSFLASRSSCGCCAGRAYLSFGRFMFWANRLWACFTNIKRLLFRFENCTFEHFNTNSIHRFLGFFNFFVFLMRWRRNLNLYVNENGMIEI